MLTRALRIVGTIMLWSDIALITSLGMGVVLLVSGYESALERAAPFLFGLIVIGVVGRIIAGIHVLVAGDRSSGDRLESFTRHVFVTGVGASRYLRNLRDDGGNGAKAD